MTTTTVTVTGRGTQTSTKTETKIETLPDDDKSSSSRKVFYRRYVKRLRAITAVARMYRLISQDCV